MHVKVATAKKIRPVLEHNLHVSFLNGAYGFHSKEGVSASIYLKQ